MRPFFEKNKNKIFKRQVGSSLLLDKGPSVFRLFLNGKQWMVYGTVNKFEERQLFSSVDLAYGKCVISGLGFGIISEMLLNNPKVTSVTVYENSEDVIEMNRLYGHAIKEVEVIHQSINDVRDINCDCLLLDHYELESDEYIVENVRNISVNNKSNLLWFWRAEPIIKKFQRQRKINNIKEAYDQWAFSTGIENLPTLTEQQLQHYIGKWDHWYL